MSQVRVQRTIQVRSDNRRDWRGRTEIVNYLGQTLFQKSEHGHTNEGFVLCEGRFGRGVAYDRVFEGPKRLDVDWSAYGHGHRRNGMRGGGKMAASPSRSKGSRLDSLHHNFKTARRTLQKMTSWSRRTHGIADQKFVQPAGDSFFLCLYLSGRNLQMPVWLLHIVLILSDLFQDPSRRTSGYNLGSLPTRTDPGHCRS